MIDIDRSCTATGIEFKLRLRRRGQYLYCSPGHMLGSTVQLHDAGPLDYQSNNITREHIALNHGGIRPVCLGTVQAGPGFHHALLSICRQQSWIAHFTQISQVPEAVVFVYNVVLDSPSRNCLGTGANKLSNIYPPTKSWPVCRAETAEKPAQDRKPPNAIPPRTPATQPINTHMDGANSIVQLKFARLHRQPLVILQVLPYPFLG
jgi:hypothetical protein